MRSLKRVVTLGFPTFPILDPEKDHIEGFSCSRAGTRSRVADERGATNSEPTFVAAGKRPEKWGRRRKGPGG